MKITLNWTNRNTGEDGTRIYRSTSPIIESALPAPLSTVLPGVLTYDDTNVARGDLFYYRMGVFKGTDMALSSEVAIAVLPSTGPGPQTLIAGDYDAGYFGEVVGGDLFTGDELALQCGVTAGSSMNSTTTWLKFAHKGSILFVAKLPIRYNLTWKSLYDLGLVYGTDNNGTNIPSAVSATPKNQLKIVTKNGDNYKVRLIRGAGANPPVYAPVGAVSTSVDATGLEQSEWNRLMYKVVDRVPGSQIGGNWVSNVATTVTGTNSTLSLTMCQEGTSNYLLLRGGYSATGYGELGYANCVQYGHNAVGLGMTILSSGTITCYGTWRPVLELVI